MLGLFQIVSKLSFGIFVFDFILNFASLASHFRYFVFSASMIMTDHHLGMVNRCYYIYSSGKMVHKQYVKSVLNCVLFAVYEATMLCFAFRHAYPTA